MRNAFQVTGKVVKPIGSYHMGPERLIIVPNRHKPGELLTLPRLKGLGELCRSSGIEFAPAFSSYAARMTLRV
jgi:hypothetical protein